MLFEGTFSEEYAVFKPIHVYAKQEFKTRNYFTFPRNMYLFI